MMPKERAESICWQLWGRGGNPAWEFLQGRIEAGITAALAEQAAEHAKALKAAVEAEREADAKIAEATHDQVFEDVYKRSGNRGVAVMRAKPCLAVAAAIRARGTP